MDSPRQVDATIFTSDVTCKNPSAIYDDNSPSWLNRLFDKLNTVNNDTFHDYSSVKLKLKTEPPQESNPAFAIIATKLAA